MEKILEITKKPFALALLVNVVLLLCFLLLSSRSFCSLDDYFMSSVLTGAYGGEYDCHLYFIQSVYGHFLRIFYALFPNVGWYYIFELLGVFCSFTGITYLLIKQLGSKKGALASTLFLAGFAPDFYFNVSFTQCAELLSASGFVLAIFGCFEKSKRSIGAGILFLVWGYVMRNDAFFLALPFAFSALLFEIIRSRRLPKELFVALACCIALIWGVRTWNHLDFQEDGYKQYAAYQGPRATFGDGRFYDFDAALSDLEEQGRSGDDLRAARNWLLYDTEVFSIDSLRPLLDAVYNNRYEISMGRTLVSAGSIFSKSLWSTMAWCWFVFGLLIVLHSKSRFMGLVPWASVGAMTLCYGYLFYLNRFVHHVEVGIWLYGVVMMLPFVGESFISKFCISKKVAIVITSFVFALLLLSITSIPSYRFSSSSDGHADLKNVAAFMEKQNGNAYLLPFDLYKRIASLRNANGFMPVEPESWQNIFPFGYWNMYLPGMVQELEKRSIRNPIRDIVNENVFCIQERDALSWGPQSVWEEHYGKKLVADTIQSFGPFDVLKYSVAGGYDEK